MISDFSTARLSTPTQSTFAPSDESGSRGASHHPGQGIDPDGDFRPMRWMLPWLWQLSQSPAPAGQAVEWEVDLPEGDRLRLKAIQVQGEWHLNFDGSSQRLQRWIGQHRNELASRLERIIRRPVAILINLRNNLQAIN